MELAARLEASRTILELNWIPREENQEADDLSNLKSSAFDPARRVPIEVASIPWLVLDKALPEGAAYFADLQRKRAEASGGGGAPARALKAAKGHRLRDREPW